jgi:DNA-binding IclR family transcriptional regulator
MDANLIRAERAGDRQFVMALARGLDVLRVFRADDGPLGNQEIARRTNLPKPTISRLTYTLTQLGYLNYDRRLGVYSLGGGALALGYVALANLDVRRVARPLMQELADACGASVGLGARDRLNMLYVENCEGVNIVALRVAAGSRIPLGNSAMGRAYIAGLPDKERAPLIDQIIRKAPDEKQSIVRAVEKAIRDIEKRGFCLAVGDWRKDINGVGAPLALPNGAGLYALNCGGPGYLLKGRDLEEKYGPMLVDVVRKVVAAMGASTRGGERRERRKI